MMDLAVLRAEIDTDPSTLGYAALVTAGNHSEIARLLNGTLEPSLGKIPLNKLLSWVAANDVMGKVLDESKKAQGANLRSSAIVFDRLLMGASDGLELAEPTIIGLLSAWVDNGLLTAEQRVSLEALGTYETPRSKILFGELVTPNQVALALEII